VLHRDLKPSNVILDPFDELKRIGVVGIDEKGELLRFGPALEIGFGDGGELDQVLIEGLTTGFQSGVVHQAVLDVSLQDPAEGFVFLVELRSLKEYARGEVSAALRCPRRS
jgi:serine/threonine protein kinase